MHILKRFLLWILRDELQRLKQVESEVKVILLQTTPKRHAAAGPLGPIGKP